MTGDALTHAEVVPLLGAMALGALGPSERDGVREHARTCASCADELAELSGTAGRLAALEGWDLLPPAHLGDEVVRALVHEQAVGRRRSRLLVAAAGVVVLVAGASAAVALADDPDPAPAAPVVAVGVRTDPGITATAGYVAHTWGLEIKLDASGLAPGGTYAVEVIDRRGRASTAGAFVGTGARVLHCNLNSGVLAQDAASFVVHDARGREVVRGDL